LDNEQKFDPAIGHRGRKMRWCCKPICKYRTWHVFEKRVPANFVPAAAVIRRGQVLFILTGRKELLGSSNS